jgi:bifunctional N-acetylglucosamine-1-phosphate-uridyltransferase/glucosamine-1-phosphate-acetyltransferase GlmU-like protein
MSRRVLIVPAAGLGSRLLSPLPKLLVPVAGTPMIDRLFDLYASLVRRTIIVCNPASRAQVEAHVRQRQNVGVAVQTEPTGMLDAITIGIGAAKPFEPRSVWITWCDQVGVHPRTLENLAGHCERSPDAPLIMPTVRRADPYIHLERDPTGRILRVLHRREGDTMPDHGESDMGVFALSAAAAFELLPAYAREVVSGAGTGERNFLPFIPWVARRGGVITFPSEEPEEAIGVNTPEELRTVEAYLQRRAARR